jgi:hypothetical protein
MNEEEEEEESVEKITILVGSVNYQIYNYYCS